MLIAIKLFEYLQLLSITLSLDDDWMHFTVWLPILAQHLKVCNRNENK